MKKHSVAKIFLFIFILHIAVICKAETSDLNGMQILLDGTHSRAEFELNGPVVPKLTKLNNPERIVVDLPQTQFGKPLQVSVPASSIIDRVKASKPIKEDLRFVFELKMPAEAKGFIKKDKSSGQQKFIVDISPVSSADNKDLPVIPTPVTQAVTENGAEPDLKEQMAILTKRFEMQQQKIGALEAKVEQQGRLLALKQQHPQIPAPPGTLPIKKGPPSAATKSQEIKRKPPRKKSIETVLREEHAIFENRFTIEPGFSYTRTDRNRVALSGFLVLDAIALGQISIDEVENDVLLFDLTGRYGITDRLQLDINLPFLHRSTTFRESAETGATDKADVERTVDLNFELSDISLGYSYQLLAESKDWPDIVWSTRVRAPTGSHPFGIKLVRVGDQDNVEIPLELPSGNGVWAITSGLSFVKSLDPVVVFASFSYTYNFEEDFDDISSKLDERIPGSIDLGNAFQFGLGFAIALNESMSMSISYSHRFGVASKTRPEGGDWKEVIGSEVNSSQLNFGLIYAITPNVSVIASIAAGLTNDAPDSQFSLKFPYSF